jgi:multicomponent Na+:H+ antiporter subunit E
MLKKLLDFILILTVWLALVWSVQLPDVIAGLIIASILMLLFGNIFPADFSKILQPRRFLWFLAYIPVFLWHVIKSNLDVAYRVFHPEMPINPGIVKVKTDLKTEVAKTLLANSITLTPGTLTVDCIDDNLYVHWINIISEDPEVETKLIVKKFEHFLQKVFE